jgi:hypothetical protein
MQTSTGGRNAGRTRTGLARGRGGRSSLGTAPFGWNLGGGSNAGDALAENQLSVAGVDGEAPDLVDDGESDQEVRAV